MWTDLLKIVSVILLSAVKFLGGTPLALAYKFSFFNTILYTTIGGISGVLAITYYSHKITLVWKKIKSLFTGKAKTPKNIPFTTQDTDVDLDVDIKYFYNNEPVIIKKKIFTKRNRLLVKLKVKYGLMGIAFLTPVLLSIPIGTFIATKLVTNKKKIILYMSVSVVFWAILLTSIFNFFLN